MIVDLIEALYRLLWGDLFTLPVAGGIGISFMVVLLFAAGIGFTLRTRLLPVRLFRDMIGAVCEKKQAAGGLSSFQTLVISTATRVGMGNLVGVVAAVSAGGAGAVFWMWVTALLGASTSFVESTLAQKYRVPDPLYGGWRGGPAYYLHVLAERKRGKKLKRSVCAALFAVSGLICWCGTSSIRKAVQLQMTTVSINTPSACTRPIFTGSSHSAAAAAQGAEPLPASLENSPRLTPFISTAPKPPAAT